MNTGPPTQQANEKPLNILVVNHTYPPDPAAVGQYVAEVAEHLAEEGHNVEVVTSRNGYEDPGVEYTKRESLNQVKILRLGLASFGKQSLLLRILGGLSFILQATGIGLVRPKADVVLLTTAPPFASLVGLALKAIRGIPFVIWLQDLNPEQSLALGLKEERDPRVRLLRALNRAALRKAESRVILDEFMERTVREVYRLESEKIEVIPPWALEKHARFAASGSTNQYREQLRIRDDQLALLYAGNHRPFGSMDAFLAAARSLADDPRFVFVFAGGGLGKSQIEMAADRDRLDNVRFLPYQPREMLGELLAAGDVHLVTMHDSAVGMTHPCKVYNAMASAKPVIYVGPSPSHVTRLIDKWDVGWRVASSDNAGLVSLLRNLSSRGEQVLEHKGANGRSVVENGHSQAALIHAMSNVVRDTANPTDPSWIPVRRDG